MGSPKRVSHGVRRWTLCLFALLTLLTGCTMPAGLGETPPEPPASVIDASDSGYYTLSTLPDYSGSPDVELKSAGL